MASPRLPPPDPNAPALTAPALTAPALTAPALTAPAPARAPAGEPIAITIKTDRTNKLTSPPSAREQQKLEAKRPSVEAGPDLCYVRNSSFLSRDIEAKRDAARQDSPTASPKKKVASPPVRVSPLKEASPPKTVVPLRKEVSPPKTVTPPRKEVSPPKTGAPPSKEISPPKTVAPPRKESTLPPLSAIRISRADSKGEDSVAARANKIETASPPKDVTSPPVSAFKIKRNDSKNEENPAPKVIRREDSIGKEIPKTEKLSLAAGNDGSIDNCSADTPNCSSKVEDRDKIAKNEESNGVGDKIKKFEKAAEDASATLGRLSRPGSVRGRSRTERLGSDGKEDFPPPATPFKDNIHFELGPVDKTETVHFERQQSITKTPPNPAVKWQRSESHEDKAIQKPEPQKIIKPEFKPMPSPVDVTIRSPSLGAKAPDQFPSQGTAFRNVASPDQARNSHKFNDDVNTQNNFKTCKLKPKEKYSVSKGSSYFTRGSEEIWLVKKKDIEEIEERVLDSFRRAGGNICMRSESMRPSSDSGQSVSFSHATMGRNKRQMYTRSESLDPQWAGARAQTLKRQTSVACTCGHDKKTRAKSASADARPRSRSHGDDASQAHVLDKYETLV